MPENLHNPENLRNEDLHKLIGGYATGTLSEAQRRELFEAALDDQELFDELARDQALKDLLAAPGVKQRLLATIEARPARVWWKHPLPWAMGGFALAVSAVLLAIVYYTPSGSRPVTVAQYKAPARPGTVIGESPAPPELQNEPTDQTRRAPKEAPKRRAPGGAPALPGLQAGVQAGTPPGQPPGQSSRQGAPGAIGGFAGAGGARSEAKTGVEAAPAPPSAPLQSDPTPGQPADKAAPGLAGRDANAASSVGALTAPTPAPFAPRMATVRPLAAPAAAAKPGPPVGRLAFDYSIYDGVLRITPIADGYVLVRATVHDDDRLVLRTSHVKANSPVELGVPEGATFLAIVLSPRPVPEESTENLAAQVPARTDLTGHLEDPQPSLISRVQVRIRLSGK